MSSDLPQYHQYTPLWDFISSIDENPGAFAGHPFAAAYAGPHRRGRGNKRPGNPTWGRPWNAQRRQRQQQKAAETETSDSSGDEKMPPTPSTVTDEKTSPQIQEKELGGKKKGKMNKRGQFNSPRGGVGRPGLRGRGGRHAPNGWKGQEAAEADIEEILNQMGARRMRGQFPRGRGLGLGRGGRGGRGGRFAAPPPLNGGPKKYNLRSQAPQPHDTFDFPELVLLDPMPIPDDQIKVKKGKGKGKGMKGLGKNKKAGKQGKATNTAVTATTDKPAAKGPKKGFKKDFTPPVDVFDTTGAYILHFSLPGAKKEDIKVNWNAKNSCLRVRGTVQRPEGVDEEMLKGMTATHRNIGVFGRRVKLGPKNQAARVYPEGISANLEEGVLTVEVPKEDKDEDEKFIEVKKVEVE